MKTPERTVSGVFAFAPHGYNLFLVTDIIAYVKMYFNIPKVKRHKKIFTSYI